MKVITRRNALARMGFGAAGLLTHRWCEGAISESMGDALTELAGRLRKTPHEKIFDLAADAIRAGADYKTLLGAAFVAGVEDIRPRHVGGKLHAVMMVESAFQLAEEAPAREALLAALFNLNEFKRSQERDRSEGDWVMPARPEVSFASEAEARREFLAAMEAWDDERADRAITGLIAHHRHESLFEILWPLAARSYVSIGHKIIYAAHVERTLRRIGWRYAETALRSLVNGLLNKQSDGTRMEAYHHSRVLAPSFPKGWMTGKEDAKESEGLLKQLRGSSWKESQEVVASAFKSGLGPATVWDGLRLLASELFLRRTKSTPATERAALLPVHAVTVINSLGYAYRTAKSDEAKRLIILQAAGWLPPLQQDLIEFAGLSMESPGIDVLGNSTHTEVSDLSKLFKRPTPGGARSLLDRDSKMASLYLKGLRRSLFYKATENHQYKYAAAMQEESRLVDSHWASRILAPAVPYLPTEEEPDTEILQRSLHALRKAGIG
ncbi:MAG: hypothetical protein L0229_30350 [Blastocatellia bacterium]|nr:hypothetical protein [Blastocatellia bacterium]